MSAAQKFVYTAEDADGKKSKGVIEASTPQKAYQALQARGLYPIKVVNESESLLDKQFNIPGMEKRVKLKHLAVFTKQFAVLIRSGMPLLRAFQVMVTQTDDPTLKKSLSAVLDDVERGESLSAAMSKDEKAFPPLMVNLVKVGEEGGFLEKTLESLAKTFKSELELRSKVRSALTYPVIVGIVSILAVAAMLIFVVPAFVEMFENLDAELPLPTQILVTISNNMVWITPLAVLLIGGFSFWFKNNKNKDNVRARVDSLKVRAPVFGKLFSKIAIARFSRNLAMLLRAGVPLMNSLKLVGGAANNYQIEQGLAAATGHMMKGLPFASTIEETKVFPHMVSQMILVGEESGSLPDMLDTIADFYEEDVKELTESLASALEPLMIVVLGGIVGGMVVALYMPMFSLFTAISEG